MDVIFLHTPINIRPRSAVELLVAVDGKTTRVAIEWATIERLVGEAPLTEDAARTFLREQRDRIERAIKAHLFAQGVPLDRKLALSARDLE